VPWSVAPFFTYIGMKNNFTKVENEFLEKIISAKLTGCEYACILFIIRKIKGWHKECDAIAQSQMKKATGYSIRQIRRAILVLVKKGFIEIIDSEKSTTIYALRADMDVPLAKEGADMDVPSTQDTDVRKGRTRMSYTKERYTKEKKYRRKIFKMQKLLPHEKDSILDQFFLDIGKKSWTNNERAEVEKKLFGK